MDGVQDILYNLDDVISHGVTDLYKIYLQFLTPEEGTICNNLFNWKDKGDVAYESVSKGPSLSYSTYCVSSQTTVIKLGTKMLKIFIL